jgi:hypothetical protein
VIATFRKQIKFSSKELHSKDSAGSFLDTVLLLNSECAPADGEPDVPPWRIKNTWTLGASIGVTKQPRFCTDSSPLLGTGSHPHLDAFVHRSFMAARANLAAFAAFRAFMAFAAGQVARPQGGYRRGRIPDVQTQIPGEVVAGSGGDHHQRPSRLGGHRSDRRNRAVAGSTENRRSFGDGSCGQRRRILVRAGQPDLRARSPARSTSRKPATLPPPERGFITTTALPADDRLTPFVIVITSAQPAAGRHLVAGELGGEMDLRGVRGQPAHRAERGVDKRGVQRSRPVGQLFPLRIGYLSTDHVTLLTMGRSRDGQVRAGDGQRQQGG